MEGLTRDSWRGRNGQERWKVLQLKSSRGTEEELEVRKN